MQNHLKLCKTLTSSGEGNKYGFLKSPPNYKKLVARVIKNSVNTIILSPKPDLVEGF